MDGLQLLDILKNPSSPSIQSASRDLEFARSQWRRIPVVLLTAKSLTQDRIQGYRKGADVYLPKPFAPEELLSILDNLIRRMKALSGGGEEEEDGGGGGKTRNTSTLRDVKADIIEIKAILKSSTSNSNSHRKGQGKGQGNARSKGSDAGRGQSTGTGGKQQVLGPSQPNSNSSAIVPRNIADKRSMYQSELDELGSRAKLTEREEHILKLLSEGHANGEIAEMTGLSLVRVSRIISSMYSKTFTKTRTELVRWAIKMGFVER